VSIFLKQINHFSNLNNGANIDAGATTGDRSSYENTNDRKVLLFYLLQVWRPGQGQPVQATGHPFL